MQGIHSYSEVIATIFDSVRFKSEEKVWPIVRVGAVLGLIASTIEVVVSSVFRLIASLCPPVKPLTYFVMWGDSAQKGITNLWNIALGNPTEGLQEI